MIVDFRLKVFICVARHLNFTRAAQELLISQPAVTNHISELERQTGLMLFSRRGRGIQLTAEGSRMLEHAERIFADYRAMDEDLAALAGQRRGQLTIGASTSIAQYLLPPILARFNRRYPDVDVQLLSENTENIEQMLLSERVDLGMIEGSSSRAGFVYDDFRTDAIVLVADGRRAVAPQTPQTLVQQPLVMRENGSGTLEVVMGTLRQSGLRPADLRVVMRIGSTEGIKRYVQNSDAMAFVSRLTIENELKLGLLQVVPTEGIDIGRTLHYVRLQGKSSKLIDCFVQFANAGQ